MSDINTLREHLFKALNGVSDGSMELEQAKAVAAISQTIINTAKVEVDFIKATGNVVNSEFIEGKKPLPPGVKGITRHQLKG